MTSLSLLNSFLVLSRVNLTKATAIGMLLLLFRNPNNNIPIAVAFIKFTRDKTKKLFNKLKDVIFMELPVMPIKSHPQKRSRFTSPNTDSIFNVLDETREERYLRRSLPRPIIPVVIQESIVFTPESVYNSDSDDSVHYESGSKNYQKS